MSICASAPLEPCPEARGRVAEIDPYLGRVAGRPGPAALILRSTLGICPPAVRPYVATCAVEGWHRVPVQHLAALSGIPLNRLKRRLALSGLTPASVAAWNLALHAAWLLDVDELSPSTVAASMQLGRRAALAGVLGARGVPFVGGQIRPGTFSATLNRYVAVLRAAFGA
jgi:hypothetical protein